MKKILLTGATGFIGNALTRHLAETDHTIRALIRPSPSTPQLPPGIPLEVAVTGLNDPRGLRAALVDIDIIYHLASEERRGGEANLLKTDIQGTQALVKAAEEAQVDRFFYLSHLGADRASAFPIMTAKAIAEESIRKSGLDYTIIRSAVVYGKNDHFTTGLAKLLQLIPFFFFLPGEGDTLIQPLWIEDLATALVWALDDDSTRKGLYKIGGPEQLSFREVVETLLQALDIQRRLVPVHTAYLRMLTVFAEYLFPSPPTNVFWLDYLGANRTCSLTALPHHFNLLPSTFEKRLEYLQGRNWGRKAWRSTFSKKP
ncbi:MAG: NAD(P)H-binding protein [Anaerolineales bacterium]